MNTSPEDGALLGLSTIGPGNYFKLPDMIVGKGGSEKAARTFEKDLLDRLWKAGLVVFNKEFDGYALTPNGGRRVAEILLLETPMEPIDALDAMATFGMAIGIQKAEGKLFMVTVLSGGASYIATHKNLGEAILIAKRKVDQALIGS